VPESVADQALYHVARQHHGNRLPVSYYVILVIQNDNPSDDRYGAGHIQNMAPPLSGAQLLPIVTQTNHLT